MTTLELPGLEDLRNAMRTLMKRFSVILAVAVVGAANPAFTDAGLIPWLYQSIFGGGHGWGHGHHAHHGHHFHHAPLMPQAPMMSAPMGMTAPMGAPATFQAGFGPDCPCPMPTACPPCPPCPAPGQSPPPVDSGPYNAAPTEAPPRRTPPTFEEPLPEDDFDPRQPREQDVPPPRSPGEFDDVLPEEFRPPAPGEPSDTGNPAFEGDDEDVLPGLPADVQAEPLDLEPTPAFGSVRAERRRVVMSAGYRIPSVSRISVGPSDSTEEKSNLARK